MNSVSKVNGTPKVNKREYNLTLTQVHKLGK